MKNHVIDVLVLGLGNPLMGDDGVGAAVIDELLNARWPDGVMILNASGSALWFLDEIARSRSLIVVDATLAGGKPGSIYRLVLSEVRRTDRAQIGQLCEPPCCRQARHESMSGDDGTAGVSGFSLQDSHSLPLTSVVYLARTLTGFPKEVVVFGVEPRYVGTNIGLSDVVKDAVSKVVREVREEMTRNLDRH